jgi:voltage-gated sodium channel
MKRLTELIVAERSVIVVILLNTIALTIMGGTEPEMAGVDWPHNILLYQVAAIVDYGCIVYFILEALLKVRKDGWSKYWESGWNRFDFIIVIVSVPALFPVQGVKALKGVLVLRLGRLFRLFRAMRFIPNREHLWLGTKRALKASVGVFFALCIVNVILSIGATVLFGRYAPEFFGDPLISSYSMFRVFSIEGWYELPDFIAANTDNPMIGVLARLYFMGALLAGGFVLVGLMNAVFVDEMTMDNNDQLEGKVDALHEEIRAIRALLESKA